MELVGVSSVLPVSSEYPICSLEEVDVDPAVVQEAVVGATVQGDQGNSGVTLSVYMVAEHGATTAHDPIDNTGRPEVRWTPRGM